MAKRLTKSQIDAAREIMQSYEDHVKKHGEPNDVFIDEGKVKRNCVFIPVITLKALRGK